MKNKFVFNIEKSFVITKHAKTKTKKQLNCIKND